MILEWRSIPRQHHNPAFGWALRILVWSWVASLAGAQGAPPGLALFTASRPVFVATADFNGDGAPDLVYLEQGDLAGTSTAHVLLNDGKGRFAESAAIVTAGSSVAVGDLSGNGHMDVGWMTFSSTETVGSSGNVVMHVAPGNGAGQFGPTVDLLGLVYSGARTPIFGFLVTARLEAAGPLALVAEDVANNRFLLLQKSSPAGFKMRGGGPLEGTGRATVADLNGDGLDDVVIEGAAGGVAQIFLTANLAQDGVPGRFAGTDGVRSLLVKDVNGDGRADLIGEDGAGRIEVYAGVGDGTFAYPSMGGGSAMDGERLVAAADLNGDGRLDVLAAGANGVVSLLGDVAGGAATEGKLRRGAGNAELCDGGLQWGWLSGCGG